MQSFNNVPIEDINYLLSSNNLSLSNNKYLTAWNFILTGHNVNVPTSIANYVIAHNLFTQKVNIPRMTIFDIISSNYKINNLDAERTIQIMKYLNKLDETDPFIGLPDEVVAKIISDSDFSCDQILTLCKISKKFGNICKYYKHQFFDKFINNAGFNIKEYNPAIICKALKLNNRVVNCGEYDALDGETYSLDIVVTSNGNVIGAFYDTSFVDSFHIKGLQNIIGVNYIGNYHSVLFLDSFGNVYKSGGIVDNVVNKSLQNPTIVKELKNIVQISTYSNDTYFLDIYGDVFKYGNKDPVLNNIVKIFNDDDSFIFLDNNHEYYVVGSNTNRKFQINYDHMVTITKLSHFRNIKNIFMRGGTILTLTKDNILNVAGAINTTYGLDKNIIKIDEADETLYILGKDSILYSFPIANPEDSQKFDNVKDFKVNSFYLTMLLNSGEIEVRPEFNDEILGLEIKGDVMLLEDPRYISLNQEIYYLEFTDDDQIKLIKITPS